MSKCVLLALAAMVCLAACGDLDFGDNPPKAMDKTDRHLTAPPLELQNGSAAEPPGVRH